MLVDPSVDGLTIKPLDHSDVVSGDGGCLLDEPATIPEREANRPIRFLSDTSGVVPGLVTLQSRIDVAAPGDTIEISPGTYRESLTLRHLLTLRATGEGVILAPDDGLAIALLGCGVTLENVTLRPAAGDGIVVRPAERSQPAARPTVTLTGCRIEAPNRAVFAMIDAVTVRLFGSTIASATGSGLMLQSDSAIRMEDVAITVRGGRGVMANDRAILQLSGTSIEGCGGDGIRVGRDSIVWMDQDEPVEIRGNAGHGIAMGPRSAATLRGTEIIANRGWGIQAPASQLTVTETVNAINRYGALDPTGNPVLTGAWVVTLPSPAPAETAAQLEPEPELRVTVRTGTVVEAGTVVEPWTVVDLGTVELQAVEPVLSDEVPGESLAVAALPELEGVYAAGRELDETVITPLRDYSVWDEPKLPPHPSRDRADDLLLRLVMIDGIEAIRLKDPRFRWLVR